MKSKELVISQTLNILNQLPNEKIKEVSDFAEFILSKLDDDILKDGIHNLIQNGNSYEFLKKEKDLYSLNDLKVKYQ